MEKTYRSKKCTKCKKEKPLFQFTRNKRSDDGLHAWCSECLCVARRIYAAKPESKVRSYAHNRKRRLKTQYGITIAQYNAMLSAAKGVCAACRLPFGEARISVDHNHATGKVRGIIHQSCNFLIGLARDNPRSLRLIAQYLQKHSEK